MHNYITIYMSNLKRQTFFKITYHSSSVTNKLICKNRYGNHPGNTIYLFEKLFKI